MDVRKPVSMAPIWHHESSSISQCGDPIVALPVIPLYSTCTRGGFSGVELDIELQLDLMAKGMHDLGMYFETGV